MSSADAGMGGGLKNGGGSAQERECGAGVWALVHGPVTSCEVSAGYPPFTVSLWNGEKINTYPGDWSVEKVSSYL